MAKILNNILISLLVLFLMFCWMQYYTKSFLWSLVTAIASAIVCCVLIQLLSKKPTKKELHKLKKKQLSALSVFLMFNCENTKLFGELFQKMGFVILEKTENSLLIQKRELTMFVALCFDFEGCSANTAVQFCKLAQQKNCKTLCLICNSIAKNTSVALGNSPFAKAEILEIEAVYSLLEKQNALPILPQRIKKQPHIALSFALSKKRFKYYLLSAFFLVCVSFLSYFPLYNLIWASILTVLAFYCLFNKRFNSNFDSTNQLFN